MEKTNFDDHSVFLDNHFVFFRRSQMDYLFCDQIINRSRSVLSRRFQCSRSKVKNPKKKSFSKFVRSVYVATTQIYRESDEIERSSGHTVATPDKQDFTALHPKQKNLKENRLSIIQSQQTQPIELFFEFQGGGVHFLSGIMFINLGMTVSLSSYNYGCVYIVQYTVRMGMQSMLYQPNCLIQLSPKTHFTDQSSYYSDHERSNLIVKLVILILTT